MNDLRTQSLPTDIVFIIEANFSAHARKVTAASRDDLCRPSSMDIIHKKIAHDMATAIL